MGKFPRFLGSGVAMVTVLTTKRNSAHGAFEMHVLMYAMFGLTLQFRLYQLLKIAYMIKINRKVIYAIHMHWCILSCIFYLLFVILVPAFLQHTPCSHHWPSEENNNMCRCAHKTCSTWQAHNKHWFIPSTEILQLFKEH